MIDNVIGGLISPGIAVLLGFPFLVAKSRPARFMAAANFVAVVLLCAYALVGAYGIGFMQGRTAQRLAEEGEVAPFFLPDGWFLAFMAVLLVYYVAVHAYGHFILRDDETSSQGRG